MATLQTSASLNAPGCTHLRRAPSLTPAAAIPAGGGSTYDPAYNAADGTANATPVKLAGGHTFLALGTAHVLHMCAIAAKPAGQA